MQIKVARKRKIFDTEKWFWKYLATTTKYK